MKLAGTIQVNAIGLPLDELVGRHEVLRTTCGVEDEPFQRIGPADIGHHPKMGRELMIDGTLADPALEEAADGSRPGSQVADQQTATALDGGR